MVTTKQIERLNTMSVGDIEKLNEQLGLTLVIENGKVTTAEYEGGNANG